MSASRAFPAPLAVAAALCAASIAACSASKDDKPHTPRDAAVACRATMDDALGAAVASYVKQAKPKPERFLVSAGTDSALGDVGLVALQDKGPTYLFPGDPALQTQVRAQLHEKGDYTTLLVVRHGASGGNKKAATVKLAGYFIGGEEDGKAAGARTISLACDSAGWHVTNSNAEQGA